MTKDQVRQQFGANAAAYVSSPTHAQGASLARLVALTDPQPGWRVLDVATATGHTALAFAPRVAAVVGLDLTLKMLPLAARLAAERGFGAWAISLSHTATHAVGLAVAQGAPPRPLGEGRGEGSAPPRPLGEGWGEGPEVAQ